MLKGDIKINPKYANYNAATELNQDSDYKQQLHQRIENEKAIAEVARILLISNNAELNILLEIVGKAVTASQVYIYSFNNQTNLNECLYEWHDANLRPQNDDKFDIMQLPHIIDSIKNNDDVIISDIDALPDKLANEKQYLKLRGVKSLIVVPIADKLGAANGFIGLNDIVNKRKWINYDVYLIKLIVGMIALYWDRNNSDVLFLNKSNELNERINELNCIYKFNRIIGSTELSIDEAIKQTAHIIPIAWKNPDEIQINIIYNGISYKSYDITTPVLLYSIKIADQTNNYGAIEIYYSEEVHSVDAEIYLKEKYILLEVLAEQLCNYIKRQLFENEMNNRLAFFVNFPAPAIQASYNGSIIKANLNAIQLFREDIIGKSIFRLLDNLDKNSIKYAPVDEPFQIEQTIDDKTFLFTIRNDIVNNSLFIYGSDITYRKRIGIALRDSEEKYRNLVERAIDGIAIIQNSNIIYVNPEMGKMLGYKTEDILKKPFQLFVSPTEIPKFAARAKTGLEGKEISARFESALIHNDGHIIDVELSIGTISFDGASSELVIARDITIRKNMENAVKKEHDYITGVINGAPAIICGLTPDGIAKYINPAGEKITGYPASELIGKDWWNILHPGPSYNQVTLLFKEMEKGDVRDYEMEIISKSGEKKILTWNLIKQFDERGNLVELIGVGNDITDRKFAEEALLESEEKYRMLVENASEGIIITQDNLIKFINQRVLELSGYSESELYEKSFDDFIHPADRQFVENMYIKQLSGELAKSTFDFRMVNKEGTTLWLQMNSVRINWHSRSAVLGFFTDVTEQYRSREQLMQSDKLAAIGTLAAGVAHEINNPIGYINSNLNTMDKYLSRIEKFIAQHKDEYPGGDEDIKEILTDFHDAIKESQEGTSRVKRIVADLKSFSRIDKAEIMYADINEGINSTLNIVWNELKYKCKVEKEFGSIPELYCIPSQLNQVFMNILINAGQSISGNAGLIKIKTWSDDSNIYISISDNGSGINKKDLKKIFEPFFTTKEVGKGTGLGLSLAYDIIHKHNGIINVESQVGVGTTFTITLPLIGYPGGKASDDKQKANQELAKST